MNPQARRQFLGNTAVIAAGTALFGRCVDAATDQPGRRMKLCLSPGSIGVSADQRQAIALAQKHGFDAVEPFGGFLAGLSASELQELVGEVKSRGLVFGAAGLPVEFRQDEAKFRESVKALPRMAAGLRSAGVDRVGTWLSPASDRQTYIQSFRQHAARLREVAQVLKEHQLRLGLEYVGTQTSRSSRRYSFVHTLAETRDLIAEIGTGNVGVVLDCWHWWQARDTEADLLALQPQDVVSVDLNDAPSGVVVDQQQDGRRELPAATGVINVKAFLGALERIGYDGPVRAEPFNKAVNELDNEAACAATIAALKKAIGVSPH